MDLREKENIEARLQLRDSSEWAIKDDLESGSLVDQHLLTADIVARDVFGDFSSPREEAQLLLAEVSSFIRTNLVTSDAMQTDDKAARLLATTIAIQQRLHIAPDGTPVPLTWRQVTYFNSSLSHILIHNMHSLCFHYKTAITGLCLGTTSPRT